MPRRQPTRHHPPHRPPTPDHVRDLTDRLGTLAGVLGSELLGVQEAILASTLLNAEPVLYEGPDGRVDGKRLAKDVRKLADTIRHYDPQP